MDTKTAEILRTLNNTFYREQSASFAATRQAGWTGWQHCLEALRVAGVNSFKAGHKNGQHKGEQDEPPGCLVFDLGCGNLRFESFLTAACPGTHFNFYAVDDCCELLPQDDPATPQVSYQNLDVLEALQPGLCLSDLLTAPPCDLSVAFGFLHHVPLPEQRRAVLSALIAQTRPGGYVIVSLWQFMKNAALRDKALATHKRALTELKLPELDEGDYLLGWNDLPGVYRYCHSFSEDEIDQLAGSVAGQAQVISRFTADGRTNNLNAYLILQVP